MLIAYLAMMVSRMLCNRASKLCHFYLPYQVALHARKHNFALPWLET